MNPLRLLSCFLLVFHNKVQDKYIYLRFRIKELEHHKVLSPAETRLRVFTLCTLQFINCTRARASARNRRRWKAALMLHLQMEFNGSLIHPKTATRWAQWNTGTTHARTRLCQYPDEVARSGAGTPQVRLACETGQMSTFGGSTVTLTGFGDPLTRAGARVLQIWQQWAGSNQKLLLSAFKFAHKAEYSC